jgi:small subunit ribosomal protein S16
MATVIRFSRHGSKKRPYYRIVVQDSRSPRDGRFIEHIGAYNPVVGASSLSVERERLEYWLSTGAQLSTSVKNAVRGKLAEWKKSPAATV